MSTTYRVRLRPERRSTSSSISRGSGTISRMNARQASGTVRPSKEHVKSYIPLTPGQTAIVLVDHQPGVLAMVGSLPAPQVTNNAATLARLGDELNLPLVITSTRKKLEFLGTNLIAGSAHAAKTAAAVTG